MRLTSGLGSLHCLLCYSFHCCPSPPLQNLSSVLQPPQRTLTINSQVKVLLTGLVQILGRPHGLSTKRYPLSDSRPLDLESIENHVLPKMRRSKSGQILAEYASQA